MKIRVLMALAVFMLAGLASANKEGGNGDGDLALRGLTNNGALDPQHAALNAFTQGAPPSSKQLQGIWQGFMFWYEKDQTSVQTSGQMETIFMLRNFDYGLVLGSVNTFSEEALVPDFTLDQWKNIYFGNDLYPRMKPNQNYYEVLDDGTGYTFAIDHGKKRQIQYQIHSYSNSIVMIMGPDKNGKCGNSINGTPIIPIAPGVCAVEHDYKRIFTP